MNNVTRYIKNAERSVNASGSFHNAAGVTQFAPTHRSGWNQASGNQTGMAAPTSQPYILTVTNASAGAISNFDIFGANTYLFGGYGTYSTGSWTYQNVTVSSGIASTTYQALLSQLLTKPISVGQMRIVFYGGSSSILNSPVTYNVTNQDGSSVNIPLIFQLNSFQQITTQVDNYQQFTLDGNSKLTFSSIPANTGFQVLLFPVQAIDVTASLVGSPVSNTFANPRVNQQSVTLR